MGHDRVLMNITGLWMGRDRGVDGTLPVYGLDLIGVWMGHDRTMDRT